MKPPDLKDSVECVLHGWSERSHEGRCPRCVREEVMAELAELACGGEPVPEIPEARPFTLAPHLDLWPRDLPWLTNGSIAPSRVAGFRRLLSAAYLEAARQIIGSKHPVSALVMLGGAMNFCPPEPMRLGAIHLETCRALLAVLDKRGGLTDDGAAGENSFRVLASVVAHLEVALRHFADADHAELATPENQALVLLSKRIRAEVLGRGRLVVEGDLVLGEASHPAMRLQELLFPSVPVRPDW